MPATIARNSLDGLKTGTGRAETSTGEPVRGLRAFRAARKVSVALPVPQLVKARYLRVRLHEDPSSRSEPYLAGSGEWIVSSASAGPIPPS